MRLQLDHLPIRSDFVETVYSVLLHAIVDGSLAPGERIPQEEIAEQLQGLIEDAPGRGVQVAALEPEWVGRLYEVRGALDTLAARFCTIWKEHHEFIFETPTTRC